MAALGLLGLGLCAPAALAQSPQGFQEQRPQRNLSPHELRCLQLEHELANDWTRHAGPQERLSKIEADIRKFDRIFQSSQARAERSGCYRNVFLFGRALVRTPKCLRLDQRIQDARRQLTRLNEQRDAARRGGTSRRRQDELIEALARQGCGRQYQREARRRGGFFSWFSDEGSGFWDRPRRDLETSRIEPYATYRTLCVRKCDGYYFPISYSTLPSRFAQDAAQCQSQCAAPAELFVYRNPGEEPEQMVSSDGQTPYSQIPNAWRYRKEYVKGCSCKLAEYNADEAAGLTKPPEGGAGAPGQGTTPAAPAGGQAAPKKESSAPTASGSTVVAKTPPR